MGWKDGHLHEFKINNTSYSEFFDEFDEQEDGSDDDQYIISDIFNNETNKAIYLYDFGDNWKHELIIEDFNYPSSKLHSYLECINGKMACPPENVGGVPGYYNFCEIMDDTSHVEYDSYNDWFKSFNNNAIFKKDFFDFDNINDELLKYIRWSRDRYVF